jgi:hypothetical protein
MGPGAGGDRWPARGRQGAPLARARSGRSVALQRAQPEVDEQVREIEWRIAQGERVEVEHTESPIGRQQELAVVQVAVDRRGRLEGLREPTGEKGGALAHIHAAAVVHRELNPPTS